MSWMDDVDASWMDAGDAGSGSGCLTFLIRLTWRLFLAALILVAAIVVLYGLYLLLTTLGVNLEPVLEFFKSIF